MFVMAAPAMAQDDIDDDAQIEQLENTIIVTAQHRQQDLQDVPIRIDVVSAEELEDAGFSSANDLSAVAPVAQVQQDQGEVNVFVRGVGTIAGNDTAVVTNIDGEYINSPSVLGIAIFDLERAEVLRGPQGTLYGRNSTAGAVNFIARKPGDEFSANASASYANYGSVRLDAGVDIPVGVGMGARAAAFYESRDGYVKHPSMGPANFGFQFPGYGPQRSDDNSALGGRLAFLADDIGGFTFYLAGEYSERQFTPQTFAYTDLHRNPPGANCSNAGWEQRIVPNDPNTYCIPISTNFLDNVNRAEYSASANPPGEINQETWAVRGRVAYEFSPAATLSYIAGYREFEEDAITPLPVVYTNYTFANSFQTQSHELRIAGEFDSGFNYQIGSFYFKEKGYSDGGFYLGSPIDGFFLERYLRDTDSDSWSLFGQAEYPITDAITLVGGLRYTDNQRQEDWRDKCTGRPAELEEYPLIDPAQCFMAGPERRPLGVENSFDTHHQNADNKLTWLAGVNYQPSPDTLVYAKVTTGFKAGGFNSGFDSNDEPNPPYAPETNTAYELGWKQNLGNFGQHILNLTGFYYDYTNLQVSTIVSTEDGSITYNAGSATIWGIEADAAFELTENDFLSFTVNYLNSELNDLFASYNVYCIAGPQCPQGPGAQDITSVPLYPNADTDVPNPGTDYSGNRPGFAPEWIITAGYTHVVELGDAGSLTFDANTTFKSSYFTTFRNYADEKQTAFTQTNLQFEYQTADEVWSIAAFVRNLENVRPLTQSYFLAAGPDDIYNWQFGTPRLYGVRIGFQY
jgi:iron complex outermembrane receptor protein